jgi:hypothetical protein
MYPRNPRHLEDPLHHLVHLTQLYPNYQTTQMFHYYPYCLKFPYFLMNLMFLHYHLFPKNHVSQSYLRCPMNHSDQMYQMSR